MTPTVTAEKTVDTQSGFKITIKPSGDQQSLSVKRQVGTVPSSSILLTPDESLKLSRILSSNQLDSKNTLPSNQQGSFSIGYPNKNTQTRHSFFLKTVVLIVLVGLVSTTILLAVNILPLFTAHVFSSNQLSSVNVEKFVHNYISSLLDFNQATYQYSQIQAMSNMTPALMNSYWQDTGFPLSSKQLDKLPKGLTVSIDSIQQTPVNHDSIKVEIQGKLLDSTSQFVNNLHLQLNLQEKKNGELQVSQQQDLTTSH